MTHPFDGKRIRYTFVFNKASLPDALNAELLSWIDNERKEASAHGEAYQDYDIRVYDDILVGNVDEETMLVTVVVFHGEDAHNLISSILEFSKAFPEEKLPRQGDPKYSFRDADKKFDDFE